jgi:hypothetical protein
MLGVVAVFWLGFTHLQGRFFVLAIPLAALLIAQAQGRAATITTGVVAGLLAVIGLSVMHPRMTTWLHEKQVAGLLGFERISEFMTPQAARDMPADATLILVGDAKAFAYQRPMSRLRYRTVFDVASSNDWLSAWIGEPPPPPNNVILVDPGELGRFARTYRALPPVPPEVLDRAEPFILNR